MSRIVTHRRAGVVWSLMAMGLATALAVTTMQARRKEDFLRGRIAALAAHDASQLQAELVSCRATVRTYAAAATASAPRGLIPPGATTKVSEMRQTPRDVAAQLAGTPPAGFDVCARMESADQAVLKTLKHR